MFIIYVKYCASRQARASRSLSWPSSKSVSAQASELGSFDLRVQFKRTLYAAKDGTYRQTHKKPYGDSAAVGVFFYAYITRI